MNDAYRQSDSHASAGHHDDIHRDDVHHDDVHHAAAGHHDEVHHDDVHHDAAGHHDEVPHDDVHHDDEVHHGHSHAKGLRHEHGCHVLQVSHLSVGFLMYDPDEPFLKAQQKETRVLDDLCISVHMGEILAVVGASGSGKSLLADSIMGLFEPNARVEGEIWFDGELVGEEGLAALRGRPGGISLVPQGVAHLDPLMRVGRQVEGFRKAGGSEAAARKRRELFDRYGLDESVADLYPFELSGGMARRVLLCTALMDDPKLIIADEPTPGLDVDLALAALGDFRSFADGGGSVMLITHDIELALRVADRVAVFKDGSIVEEVPVEAFRSPETLAHPYSVALWHAMPEHGFGIVPSAGERSEGEGASS